MAKPRSWMLASDADDDTAVATFREGVATDQAFAAHAFGLVRRERLADVIELFPELSRSSVTDRDAAAVSQLQPTAGYYAKNPEAFSALLAEVERLRPGVTVQYLDSLPPQALPQALEAQHRLANSAPSAPANSDPETLTLSGLTTELLSRLEAHGRSGHLALVTLTAPPGRPIAPLIDFRAPGVLGCWFVVEATPTGQHVHGLLLADSERTARAFPAQHAARHGLEQAAQDCAPERGSLSGWNKRGNALRRGVFNVARYALALERHAKKRKQEVPVQVLASGIFEGVEALADFALSRSEDIPPTVTDAAVTVCACGCGQPPKLGLRYVDQQHSARARQARSRSNKRTKLATVTPPKSPPVTVPDLCPETVTAQPVRHETPDAEFRTAEPTPTPTPATKAQPVTVVIEQSADPVTRAAEQAVQVLGEQTHPSDLERETRALLALDFEPAPTDLALEQAVRNALRAAWGIPDAAE